MSDRPNIWLILCDQLRADALGCYGNPIVRTPHIDALAERGTVYESAYTPAPVCVPARASLITGLEPEHTGCFENGWAMPEAPTMMDRLTEDGYRTHGVGKMHFTPQGDALRGFQTRDREEEFGSPGTDDYLAHLVGSGFDHVRYPHGLRDEMYYIPQLSPMPERLHPTRWVADRSIDFLQRERDEERPFFLWSSFIAPHPPFTPPEPWHALYPPSLMPGPKRPAAEAGLLTVFNKLQNRYKFKDQGEDRRLLQLTRAFYYASISYVDAQIGRIRETLEALGRLDNTVIVFTSDHGEFMGDYGSFGKRSFLDAAARVPMICAGPGVEAGARSRTLTGLIDVAPTALAAAGLPTEGLDGIPLTTATEGRTLYGQMQQGPVGLYMVLTDRWKYIWSAYDRREYLLDRRDDPDETQNQAYNVRLAATVRDLRANARSHFADLRAVDIAAQSGNAPLSLGHPTATSETLASYAGPELDAEASTLIVQSFRRPDIDGDGLR